MEKCKNYYYYYFVHFCQGFQVTCVLILQFIKIVMQFMIMNKKSFQCNILQIFQSQKLI